jgi:hypothetical protein
MRPGSAFAGLLTSLAVPIVLGLGTSVHIACSSHEGDGPPADAPDGAVYLPEGGSDDHDAARPPADAGNRCDGDAEVMGLKVSLSCTGLYDDIVKKTLAPGVEPFAPGMTLWSDGAAKSRFIYLPPGTKIDSTNMDEWIFPVGTRVWKEFRLADKRIETRHFWKARDDFWRRVTYRWNDDETEATLLTDGATNVNGTSYEIPSVTACDSCHVGSRDRLLGFEANSLAHPQAEGLTLATLVQRGLLTRNPSRTALVLPEDGTGTPLAMVYLHANCGTTCHNSRTYAPARFTDLDMRLYAERTLGDSPPTAVTDLPAYAQTVGQDMKIYKSGPALRIKPASPADSGLFYLATRRTDTLADQMPPLVSHVPDPYAIRMLSEWINALH